MQSLLTPVWVVRFAVAAVWLYEGLWCKLLGGEPHQIQVVQAVPSYGPCAGALFLKALGVGEVALGIWAFTGFAPVLCAVAQTILLVSLNTCDLIWARHIIHDPAGMVVMNFSFLVLAWVGASLS
jgi:uncharacterized membrane protein YphA (DoxX/SURF4 family)